MTETYVLALLKQSAEVAATVSGPMLLSGLLFGLIIAILQAATQIQESSLAFLPKLMAMGGAAILFGPFIIETMSGFTEYAIVEVGRLGPGGTP